MLCQPRLGSGNGFLSMPFRAGFSFKYAYLINFYLATSLVVESRYRKILW